MGNAGNRIRKAGWTARRARFLFFIVPFAASAILLVSCEKPASTAEPLVTLQDASGAAQTPLADDGQKMTVLLFLMHDCPIANATAPAIGRLVSDFESRGVKFFGIYATETAEEITTHLTDYELPLPGLFDPECLLARRAGATRVPEAAVYSPDGELLYRGRIDDRATELGSIRPKPSREDLRLALGAILAGNPVESRITEAVGCYLPIE